MFLRLAPRRSTMWGAVRDNLSHCIAQSISSVRLSLKKFLGTTWEQDVGSEEKQKNSGPFPS